MGETDLDRMRDAYDGASRGDLTKAFAIMDPAIEIRDRAESPDAGTYVGYEGVQRALRLNDETFDELELRPERFFRTDDHVVVVVRLAGRGKQSGAHVEERIAHLWDVRDGKVTALQVYSDPDEALAAAGITERVGN